MAIIKQGQDLRSNVRAHVYVVIIISWGLRTILKGPWTCGYSIEGWTQPSDFLITDTDAYPAEPHTALCWVAGSLELDNEEKQTDVMSHNEDWLQD